MKFTTVDDLWKYSVPTQISDAKVGYRGLKWSGKVHFTKILVEDRLEMAGFHKRALKEKDCFIGPFIGEFGNLLGNILPYLSFLHSKGVKIHYCGFALQKPLLVDESGVSLLASFEEVRDILGEYKASANSYKSLPEDVSAQLHGFKKKAEVSGKPFLNIFFDHNLYWYTLRHWQLKGRQHVYDLGKFYAPLGKKNKVVIFPRSKGSASTPNNGDPWDYDELALLCTKFFDDVCFVGHPSMSASLNLEHEKVNSGLSTDNAITLAHCAEADLIITQHSGAMQLGGLISTDILCIYKGKPPIGSFANTLLFNTPFKKVNTNVVFDFEEVEEYLRFRKS